MRLPPGFAPTPFQQRRLNMLLDILDAVLGRERTGITTHEIARCHVYPAMSIGRGNEWQSSAARRRNQRLIADALALAQGGTPHWPLDVSTRGDIRDSDTTNPPTQPPTTTP